MKIVGRYILREVAWPCALAFVVICFVGAAIEFRERSSELNLDFLRPADFARLALYFVPTLFSYTVPITFMMGVLLAFGGMAQNSELVAMRAAGIPLKRLIAPVVAAGLGVSVFSLYLQAEIQPWAVKRTSQLILQELFLRGTMDALPPGKMHTFDAGGGGAFRVYFAEKDTATQTLRNIDIFRTESDGTVTMFHAKAARVVYADGAPRVELTEASFIQPTADGLLPGYSKFRPITGPQLFAKPIPSDRDARTLRELFADEREAVADKAKAPAQIANKRIESTRQEIAERLALPMACFAVCFCAAPLAARGGRQGRSYSFFIGLAIGLSYYLLMELFTPSSLRSMGEMVLRAMAPNIALTLVGLFFLWRVDRI